VTTLKITQQRSRNGSNQQQIDTLRSLGLRKIGHSVEREDSPQVRGMLYKVRHLVKVSEDG
jgi:large subunit ribosomal protein L30